MFWPKSYAILFWMSPGVLGSRLKTVRPIPPIAAPIGCCAKRIAVLLFIFWKMTARRQDASLWNQSTMKFVIWSVLRFCPRLAVRIRRSAGQACFVPGRLLDAYRVKIGNHRRHQELYDWYEKLGFEEIESKKFPQLVLQVAFGLLFLPGRGN